MSSISFNGLAPDILSAYISGKTFYAHLVTAVPVATNSTVADLTVVSGGTYAVQTLANVAASAEGTGGKVTADNPVWSGFYAGAATDIVGLVVCERAGGSPASTDEVRSFIRLTTGTAIASVSTTNGSPIVTTSNSFSALSEGEQVSGTGIPSGTYIVDKTSNTQLVLSKSATATGTITLTGQTPNPYTPPSSSGGATDFTFTLPSTGIIRILN